MERKLEVRLEFIVNRQDPTLFDAMPHEVQNELPDDFEVCVSKKLLFKPVAETCNSYTFMVNPSIQCLHSLFLRDFTKNICVRGFYKKNKNSTKRMKPKDLKKKLKKKFTSLFGATADEETPQQATTAPTTATTEEVQVSGWVVVFIIVILVVIFSQAKITSPRGQYYNNDGSYYDNNYNRGYNNGPRRPPPPPPMRRPVNNGGGGGGIKFTAPKVGLNLKNLGKGSILSLK